MTCPWSLSPINDAISALSSVSTYARGGMWKCKLYRMQHATVVHLRYHGSRLLFGKYRKFKKRRYTPTEARRHWDKHRNKTRMNINMVFPKWRELCENLELDRDSALACVLIER